MSLSEPRWPRIFSTKFVCAVATLGPLGTRLPAPGSWGALAGTGYFYLIFRHARWEVNFAWTVVASLVAVVFCGEAARRQGRTDPGEVNLDEFAVMPLVFLGWRSGCAVQLPEWSALLLGFGLFRFYDILKPLGISRLQHWPGGWGVVADDFAAALAACGTLHAASALWVWLR